jgi:putative transposase
MFRLKGFTSFQLRKEYPHLKKIPSLWTRSYFCGTVGNASEETVKNILKTKILEGGRIRSAYPDP